MDSIQVIDTLYILNAIEHNYLEDNHMTNFIKQFLKEIMTVYILISKIKKLKTVEAQLALTLFLCQVQFLRIHNNACS